MSTSNVNNPPPERVIAAGEAKWNLVDDNLSQNSPKEERVLCDGNAVHRTRDKKKQVINTS